MKKILFLLFIVCQNLNSIELNYHENSDHFLLACAESDQLIASEILSLAESMYSKLSIDFQHDFKEKININIYPNTTVFHEAMELTNAPSWVVAKSNQNTIFLVSPTNPGPSHTKERILKILLLNVSKTYIYNQFGLNCAPYWLVFGVSAKQADYFPKLRPSSSLPPFEKLEQDDYKEFELIGGYAIAPAFASYIEANYGWDKVLSLFTNYSAFEDILNISKETLYQQWIESLN